LFTVDLSQAEDFAERFRHESDTSVEKIPVKELCPVQLRNRYDRRLADLQGQKAANHIDKNFGRKVAARIEADSQFDIPRKFKVQKKRRRKSELNCR